MIDLVAATSPEEAERQFLRLIRLQPPTNFSLAVIHEDGRWMVTAENLDSGAKVMGEGESFAEAWHFRYSV